MSSKIIATIKRPPKFLTLYNLEKLLLTKGIEPSSYTPKIITENQMPIEIELTFSAEKFLNDFISNFKDKEIDENFNIKLDIDLNPSALQSSLNPVTNEYKFAIDYPNLMVTSFERKKDAAGLILTDKYYSDNLQKTVLWLVKKVGKALMNGQSVMNISLPVYIFDKRSMLETFACELVESPTLLSKAYHSQLPLEKMKYMCCFFVAQLYHSTIVFKPFNPIIGETFQIKIGNMNVYLEQTSHKPPVGNFYIYDDDGTYKFHGYLETNAKTGANSCKATKSGKAFIEFKDGFKYRLYYPNIYLGGTTVGKKDFNYIGNLLVCDETTKICSLMKVWKEKKGLLSFFGNKKSNDFPDKITGKIMSSIDLNIEEERDDLDFNNETETLSEITGYWTQELKFDGVTYWERNVNNCLKYYEPVFKLKSDSTFREDMQLWIAGDEVKAQEKKEEYEQIQRDDVKLREKYFPTTNKDDDKNSKKKKK